MNIILWAWHIAVLYFSWPLLRDWWHGAVVLDRRVERKRWLVALSIGMPPVAAVWLLPFAIAHRADLHKQERLGPGKCTEQRAGDIAFWREQVATGDPVSAMVGAELLEMWRVPVVEPRQAIEIDDATWGRYAAQPRSLPGAHQYSHGCGCRNCVRARKAGPSWLLR